VKKRERKGGRVTTESINPELGESELGKGGGEAVRSGQEGGKIRGELFPEDLRQEGGGERGQ